MEIKTILKRKVKYFIKHNFGGLSETDYAKPFKSKNKAQSALELQQKSLRFNPHYTGSGVIDDQTYGLGKYEYNN